jgi:hypothetical protein
MTRHQDLSNKGAGSYRHPDLLMATRLVAPTRRASERERLAALPRLERASVTLAGAVLGPSGVRQPGPASRRGGPGEAYVRAGQLRGQAANRSRSLVTSSGPSP